MHGDECQTVSCYAQLYYVNLNFSEQLLGTLECIITDTHKNPWKVTFKLCFFVTYQLNIEKNIFTLIHSRHLVSHLLLTRKICHYHSASILLHKKTKSLWFNFVSLQASEELHLQRNVKQKTKPKQRNINYSSFAGGKKRCCCVYSIIIPKQL